MEELLETLPSDSLSEFFSEVPEVRKWRSSAAQQPGKAQTADTPEIIAKLYIASQPEQKNILSRFLQAEVAQILGMDASTVDLRKGLMDMGMDSLGAVNFRNRLKGLLGAEAGKRLPATLVFDCPTVEALTDFLLKKVISPPEARPGSTAKLSTKLYVSGADPIAIIGMSCRFPGGANDLESYWKLLTAGQCAIREVPEDRWVASKFYDPNPDAPGKTYVTSAVSLRRALPRNGRTFLWVLRG